MRKSSKKVFSCQPPKLTANEVFSNVILQTGNGRHQISCLQIENHQESDHVALEVELVDVDPNTCEMIQLECFRLQSEHVTNQLCVLNAQAVGECYVALQVSRASIHSKRRHRCDQRLDRTVPILRWFTKAKHLECLVLSNFRLQVLLQFAQKLVDVVRALCRLIRIV